jgi:hypothetical protein
MKRFNIAGPCNPAKHYMLPPTDRLAEDNVRQLIEDESYFVLHAPRQVGKTTAMLALARELTQSGKYVAVLVSMEVGAGLKNNLGKAETALLGNWRQRIRRSLPAKLRPSEWPDAPEGQRINEALGFWAETAPLPLVIFLDEIDSLEDDVMISVLRQLRSGYDLRPDGFPASLALIGLRDVQDYKVMSGGSGRLGTPSPFNIAVESLTLRNFTVDEVRKLLSQHTAETGQAFTDEAMRFVFDLTEGHPWLVNAVAKVCVERLVKATTTPIDVERVERAKEIVIAGRYTHFGQLTDKLREERVRRVIEPILAGVTMGNVPADDRDYVVDLGLARRSNGGLEIANPIYRELIPRYLASDTLDMMPLLQPTWLNKDGSLNPDRLLNSFLEFWRQHGEPLLKAAPYHEIAPHLVMMAYLHRVVNGGGTLEREYAIGTDRMDLYLRYGAVRLGIELKVWRDGRPDPLRRGLEQLDEYLAGLGLDSGWLVIFDRRGGQPPISERTTTEAAISPASRRITVIRA